MSRRRVSFLLRAWCVGLIKGCSSVDEIVGALGNVVYDGFTEEKPTKYRVRETVAWLGNEGFVYSTVDEDHFRSRTTE